MRERLRKEVVRRYSFEPKVRIDQVIRDVSRGCVVCQAHHYPNFQVLGPIESTPVCPELGVSVCLDMFMMPSLEYISQRYDSMMICVDPLSGWMIVTPHLMKGLTAEVAARAMVERWWKPFGVPVIVTSDEGP